MYVYVCSEMMYVYYFHRQFRYKGDTSTHAEETDPMGRLKRASENQEALWLPVLNARHRQKRQHLHLFTETKKHSPNTGARANNTVHVNRAPHRGPC